MLNTVRLDHVYLILICRHIMYVYANCVCLPFQMVRGFGALGRVRRWVGGWVVVVLGPHLPGSALCSRNLSFSLLRQCREHVKLWHMVARVTCSLWSFGPWSETVPPCMTPAVLHLPCSLVLMCFGPSIHLAGLHPIRYNWLHDFVYGSGGPHDKWCIEWNAHLQNSLFFVCLFACLLSGSPDKRLTGPPPSDLHLSTVLQLARQTWLSSLPPTCIGLLSSHLCKYEREREMARGRVERAKWKNIPAFGYWAGCRKEKRTAEQTSMGIGLHLYTFLLSVFSLNPFSLSVMAPTVIVS